MDGAGSGWDIEGIHHVGHVVARMDEALAVYERLGFVVAPPAYPALAAAEGEPPQPFGAANTHAEFPRNFIEVVTYVRDGQADQLPANATLVPLQAPADVLPELVTRIRNTSETIAECLDRFEGLHILMLSSPDIAAAAERLSRSGFRHGGVNAVQRPVHTDDGTLSEPVRYLEIDGDRPGAVAEGRVGVAGELEARFQRWRQVEHPNGAVDLVEVLICAAGPAVDELQSRYERYLGREARRTGVLRVFDLGQARLSLVADTDCPTILPGEHPPALPVMVAYAVAVRDVRATRDLLQRNGFPLAETADGDLFVPASAALGAAIIFRG